MSVASASFQSPLGDRSEPIGDLNTTPLIDIMLVLLVMFIITVPIQTHAVKLDLPAPSTVTPRVPVNATRNMLTVAVSGDLAWNGAPVSDRDARALLVHSAEMAPAPELHLRPDAGAPYGRVDEVLAMIKRAGVKRFGFVGNETYLGDWSARAI